MVPTTLFPVLLAVLGLVCSFGNAFTTSQSSPGPVSKAWNVLVPSLFATADNEPTLNCLQRKIFDDLTALTEADKAFYYTDCSLQDTMYRIFSYRRFENWTQWEQPSALESRGITFELNNDNEPTRVASWPFSKLFSVNENPMTQDLDLSAPLEITKKLDGTLVSSMLLPNGGLHLKTHRLLDSEEARDANTLIRHPDWKELYDFTLDLAKKSYTVIMEYTSPFHQHVVPCPSSKLTVLAIRNHLDGSFVPLRDLDLPPEIAQHCVEDLIDQVEDPERFLQSCNETEGVEGYVVLLQSGQRVKFKTEWYFENRGTFNFARSDLQLAEAVWNDDIDDLRSRAAESPEILERINYVTPKAARMYNEAVEATTQFYEANNDLSGEDYAIKAKEVFSGDRQHLFGVAMYKYRGHQVDVVKALLTRIKKVGLPEDE